MSPQMQQPLYTTVPWSPSNFYPKDQDTQFAPPSLYPYSTLVTPFDYPTNLLPATEINTYPLPSQEEAAFISPITPGLIAPAPTPEAPVFSNQQQITYPTQSPWSSGGTNHQLRTPQYPFFPSTIFIYPQPSQQFSQSQYLLPQNDINMLPHYTFPINQYPNTQGNATEDLYKDNNTAYAYSTSFGPTHQHDMFQLPSQHEAWVNNAGIDNGSGNGTGSERVGYKIEWELIDPRLQGINQSIPQSSIIDTNSINIDHPPSRNFIPKFNIFRDSRSMPNTGEPTINPKLSSGGNMVMGGEQSGASGTIDPQHDRISAIPIPIPPCPANVESHDHEHEDLSPTPTKRGRWSTSSLPVFSRKSTTTPLRKRRPPQLHLPPPSANMTIPTATIHSAPAASFSLDLFVPPTQRVDTNAIVPQEPPPVEGWISPEQRPLPPLGYTVPGSELVPKIFEYGSQGDDAVPAPPIVSVDNVTTTAHDPPALPQTLPFQPYEPKAIPRVTSDPQLRIPTTSSPSPPAPYIIVPGLNGFEVFYWRPQPRSDTQHPDPDMFQSGSFPIGPQPPTTAAPWEVSVPPIDPSLPPSTASSLRSISTLDGHFIPKPQEVEPVVYLNHELRNRGKTKVYHPPRYDVPGHEKKETWAICEVCNATISRTSDLQRHMRKHTGEKPYHCPYCTSSYARNDKLSGHILKNHPGRPRIIHRAKAEVPHSNPDPNQDPTSSPLNSIQ